MTELEKIALAMDVTPDALSGRCRTSRIIIRKRIAAWYLHEVKGYTYQEIGRMLNKDHTTILDHKHNHSAAVRTWREYADVFRSFMKTMSNNI